MLFLTNSSAKAQPEFLPEIVSFGRYDIMMFTGGSCMAHPGIVQHLRFCKLRHCFAAFLWAALVSMIWCVTATPSASVQNKPEGVESSIHQNKKVMAQKVFESAERLRSEGTAASLKLALEKYSRALQLLRELGEPGSEALVLNNVGFVYDSLGEKQKALDYYKQALPIERATGSRSLEATTLSNIGFLYDSLGEKQTALGYLTKALPIIRAVGDHLKEAATLNAIGLLYYSLGVKQKALDYYDQALSIERAAGNRSGEAATLNYIGLLYDSLGEKPKAVGYFNQALHILRAVGDRSMEAATLSNLGRTYGSLGENQKAIDYDIQALTIERQLSFRSGEAKTLNNLGYLHEGVGETTQALEEYNQAVAIARALGDHFDEAKMLNNIGGIYEIQGEKQKALDCYLRSLSLIRALGGPQEEATSLNNIGVLYDSLGNYQAALSYYNQALPIIRAVGDRFGEAATLNNIGHVYESLGDKDKALDYYSRALPVVRAVGHRPLEATTLSNIALVYYSLGEKQRALEVLDQALTIDRSVSYRHGEATTLNNMGSVYSSLNEKEKALNYINQALVIERGLGDRSMQATTLGEKALLNFRMLQLNEARTSVEEALTIIESLRSNIIARDLRSSYFSSQAGYYSFYVDVLMQLHRQHPEDGYDRLAFEASERGKARGLLDLLTESQAHIYRGADPKLLASETAIRQQLDAQAQQKTKLLNGMHTTEQLNEMEQRLRSLSMQYEQVEAQIRQNSPQYAALTQPHAASVAEVQKLLDSDSMLLEYSLGQERSYLWLVTPTSFASFELPKGGDIDQGARQIYGLLTSRIQRRVPADKEYEVAAASLSSLLLGKVGSQLGHHRLLIVADGALNYIPFGALPAPRASTSFSETPSSFVPLLIDHEVVQLPSASVLAQLRREATSRQQPAKQLFVVADPVFSREDPRLKRNYQPQSSSVAPKNRGDAVDDGDGAAAQIEASQLTRSAGDVGVARVGEALPRLEGSREEAKSIVALAPGQSKLVLDFDASRITVTGTDLTQYRYVHFATHGLVDTEHPELSGLVLSMVNERGEPINGYLRLQDIFNLNLPVELVVLSACETGLGKEVRGEGLLGLTRGFMYAGSPRVVVSLWKVDDAATAELMRRFYDGMLNQKLRPAAALRAAQLGMWNESAWHAPYFWAAFVLQGEWN